VYIQFLFPTNYTHNYCFSRVFTHFFVSKENNMSDSDNSSSNSYSSRSEASRSDKKSGGGNHGNHGGQRVSYSTDYHVDMLEDTQKMQPKEKRKPYFVRGMTSKPIPEHNNGRTDEASESMDDYLSDSKKGMESDNLKKHGGGLASNTNYFANDGNGGNASNASSPQTNSQIFSKFVGADDYDTLPPDAQMMKRLNLMRRLGELARDKGITLSQKYNINSDYYMMKYEYNLHKDIIDKQEFTNVATSVMRYAIYGLEKLNENYNTVLDLRLNGWSDDVGANMEKFTSIWGDIYEKYNQPGKGTEPEYRLIFALACGGIGYHMNNSGDNRKPQRKERDPDAELRRDEELRQKERDKHKQAEKQVMEMARLNEINQQNENLRLKQEQLQKEREEFEQFRQAQQFDKQRMQAMMMNSQQYANNNGYDMRQKQIGEQLNSLRNTINQNTVPIVDFRGEPSMTKQPARQPEPDVPRRKELDTKKKGISVDTSSTSTESDFSTTQSYTPKNSEKKSVGSKGNTAGGRSTASRKSTTVKRSGGITIAT
jgi:hypothetical protein